jgi:hypothetical protein
MSMADDLTKLDELHQAGALSDAEFETAKRRLLNAEGDNSSLGRAANRYVSFQIVAGAIGLIVFLVFLFGVILPAMNRKPAPTVPDAPTLTLQIPPGVTGSP